LTAAALHERFEALQLAGQPGRVHSRQQLIEGAYRDHHAVSDRTVDSHIKNLRRKLAALGADPIASVYGVDYRLEWPVGEQS
jgi:two-component system, OmpR family, response regulator BaeR